MEHLTPADLDRLEHLRGTEGALPPDTQVLTFWGDRALLREGRPVAIPLEELWRSADFGDGSGASPGPGPGPGDGGEDALVLLGDASGTRYAARAARSDGEAARLEAESGGRFESLRTTSALLPPAEASLLFYGAAMQAWHARSRYCGACGSPTRATRAGHQRQCGDAACGAIQFPRTDPAIITLVRRGEQGLLLHQPRWPAGRFSTLAGFVEPGETLEGGVVREVAEEVGLRVVRTEYVASQPWPFPHTLMIGFRTWVADGEVVLGEEIEDARWYTRQELVRALDAAEVTIPPPFSLSRSLIEEWLGEGGGAPRRPA